MTNVSVKAGDYNDAAYDGESGVDSVVSVIKSLSPAQEGPKVDKLSEGERAYADWLRDKSSENMSKLLSAYAPTINSEITRYSGPQTLLRSKAKVLTVNAIKTFNPMSGTRLNSWIVTNLKPLSRYSVQQRDIHVPEVAARQAAAVDRATNELSDELGREPTDEELADELGISVKRVKSVRSKSVASVTSGKFDESESDDMSMAPGVHETDKVPFAQEAVYMDLSDTDKLIFDAATGSHGVSRMPVSEVSARLGISPGAVSQRARAIGERIAYVVNNG